MLDFSFFLVSIFVYELILIKISMNVNIMKRTMFHEIKWLVKVTYGHLKISKSSFNAIYFCLTPNLLKTFKECQHYENEIFSLNEV